MNDLFCGIGYRWHFTSHVHARYKMGGDRPVELLILGAGWTSQFLIPLLEERQICYAATSRSGRNETLKFEFDPDAVDKEPFLVLPASLTVLITFPIYGKGGSQRLVNFYKETHPDAHPQFIQLGSTGIYDVRLRTHGCNNVPSRFREDPR